MMSPGNFIAKLSSISLCLWWGGLTFYAAAVVPIGTDLFGAEMQGMVTQQATNWLNLLGWVTVVMWAIRHNETLLRNRSILIPWLITWLTLVMLFFIHRQLDAFLAQDTYDDHEFYSVHRWYLITTTIQWISGVIMVWQDSPPTNVEHSQD